MRVTTAFACVRTIAETVGQVTVAVYEKQKNGNAEKVDCHIHFGLSPDCPAREWTVRRGVIWPAPYLDDWRNARNTSPADEIRAWAAAHPTACADAAADPTAADAG